ncbi:MAG: hypothetical protein ACOCRX_10910 [Candidatus Woesearchaeota archaeon]
MDKIKKNNKGFFDLKLTDEELFLLYESLKYLKDKSYCNYEDKEIDNLIQKCEEKLKIS